MNCDEALLAISAALDGELPPKERLKLSEHLLGCENCRELAEDLRVLTEELGHSGQEVPPGLADAVLRAVAEEPRAAHVPKRRRAPYLRTAAAMLALCAGLGGIGLFAAGRMGMKGDCAGGAAPALYQAAPETREYSVSAPPEDAEDAGVSSDAAAAGGEPEAPMEAAQPYLGGETPVPMPSSAPAPAGVMAVDGDGSNEKAAPGSEKNGGYGPSSDGCEETVPGSDAVLTPEEALELVFEYIGGYEAYPQARRRTVCMYGFDAPAYYLKTVENDTVSSEYCLDYAGFPPEGEGCYFHFYEMVTDKREDGFDHTATSNWYTVSPDGEITAEFPELPIE